MPTSAAAGLLVATAIALQGGPPVSMDYIAYDPVHHRLWVPAGNTGAIDVIEDGKVHSIPGQATAPSPRPGRPNMGASSATVAGDRVFVGNRADRRVCAFDAATYAAGACMDVGAMPDGITWVDATREVWVTTPAEKSLTLLGPEHASRAVIALDGAPEGLTVDNAHGRFYTNLEDKDHTLAIDVHSRKVVAEWPTGCGGDGPRGLDIDVARGFLFVGCASTGAVVLDLTHDGRVLGHLAGGAGVDNIGYDARARLLLVAAGKEGTLTIGRVGDDGQVTPVASLPTAVGARTVLGADDVAYVADPQNGRVLVVPTPK
jgi:DNA-binding beta-propeller fold protein YncE